MKNSKKFLSVVLASALSVSAFASLVTYAEETKTAEVYNEIYSVDFDKLAATETTTDQSALQAEYANTKLVSDTSNWNYKITERADGDKALYLSQTTASTSGNGGNTGVLISVPDGGLKTGEKYKISYDIMWPTLTKNGPYIRTKTLHYGSTKYDNFGPVLNAMSPQTVDGNVKMYGSHSTQDHTSAGNDSSWFATSINEEQKVALDVLKWHNVEMIIDTTDSNNKKIDYYYDDVYAGTQSGVTFPAWAVNPGAMLEILVFQGNYQWDGAYLDNISIAKATKTSATFDANDIVVSGDKKEVKIDTTALANVKAASFVNNATGDVIPATVKSTMNGIKLSCESALSDNAEYIVYLDSTSGTTYGIITLGTVADESADEKWTDIFEYNFDDGNVPTVFTADGVSVEDNVMKLSSSSTIDMDMLLADMGNKGNKDATIPANSGIYELSFDLKVKREGNKAPLFQIILSNKKDNINAKPFFVNQWDAQMGVPTQDGAWAGAAWYDKYTNITTAADETWYNIKMVMDTDTGKIKYYVNDTLKLENNNINWWKNTSEYYGITEGIDGLRIRQEGAAISGEKTSYVDNIKLRKKATYTDLFAYSFNDGNVPEEIVSTDAPLAVDASALKLSSASAFDFKFNLANAGNLGTENVEIPANSGIYELGFDIKVKKEGNYAPYFYLLFSNEKGINTKSFFVHQWSSLLGVPTQNGAWAGAAWYDNYTNITNVSDQTWYNIKMVMDTNTGRIKYYVNGTLKLDCDNINWWKNSSEYYNITQGIKTIRIIQQGAAISGEKTSYLDNITLKRVNVNATSFSAEDIFGNKLPKAAAYDRAINSITLGVDGVPSVNELNSITLSKDGAFVEADATYSANAVTVTPAADLANGEYTLSAFGNEYVFDVTYSDDVEILSFVIADTNGGTLAENDTVKATALFRNKSANTEVANVILATYTGGRFVTSDFAAPQKNKLIEEVTVPLTITEAADASAKAFIWDDFVSPEPLAKDISVGNN